MIINGRIIAENLNQKTEKRVKKLKKQGYFPEIAVILVGNNEASSVYVKQKEKLAKKLGFKFFLEKLPKSSSQKKIIESLQKIQKRSNLCGVIIQLPLPEKIKTAEVLKEIKTEYDIDVLTEANLGKLVLNNFILEPPTAGAVMEIIQTFNLNLAGKKILLIGTGLLVGRPLSLLLIHKKATVTLANSQTKKLINYTQEADIVISGVGIKNLLTLKMVKKGQIVIDAGFSSDKKGQIFGDADVLGLDKKGVWITPTPGGVGPITVAKLMQNAVICAENKFKK